MVCQGAVCTIRQLSSCTRSKINSWNNLGGQNSSITSSNVNHQYFKLYLISPHHGMGYFCFLDKWEIFVHKENKRLLHESENLLKCTSILTQKHWYNANANVLKYLFPFCFTYISMNFFQIVRIKIDKSAMVFVSEAPLRS